VLFFSLLAYPFDCHYPAARRRRGGGSSVPFPFNLANDESCFVITTLYPFCLAYGRD